MPKRSKAPHRADARGGGFILIPHSLIDSEALRTLPFRARAALLALMRRFDGYNNGRICLSTRQLAEALGTSNYRANSEALACLEARGIIALERSYEPGSRKSREFRLTFVSTGEGPGQQASNDYRVWRQGDAGTGKKRAVIVAAESRGRAASNAAGAKLSATTFTAAKNLNLGNPRSEISATVVNFPAHLVNHTKAKAVDGNTANSAPDADVLRQRVLDLIGKIGRGTQSRLGFDAEIPLGTLSKFLRKGGPLPACARLRLTMAIARLEHWKERSL